MSSTFRTEAAYAAPLGLEKPGESVRVLRTCTPNTVAYRGRIDRAARERQNGYPAKVFWFTGLSGSGKSTLAHRVEELLHERGIRTYVFDGDNVRQGLCGDLGFSQQDRTENLRRIAEMARLFLDAGTVCMAAFISPLAEDRERVRGIVGNADFHEIYVKCPVCVCEERDVKGLYKLARAGRIKNYTGVSAPYEEPENPALLVETDKGTVEGCARAVLDFIIGELWGELWGELGGELREAPAESAD
ncbi:Adenylyl-sulfate kinase [Desulfovibrio sp. X2]|uniref:adenylyl-sulfate kinase n=1 Tax=Desulfovibrio sp. X2 TaxID=941449 RepID=UPI000358BF00|nr:adenylyl-sulfate kinase [Desulfovibrio sp. X2]EPR37199.1 Adenylyl-sulfate kinase [Desulfovibrio sp. X2]